MKFFHYFQRTPTDINIPMTRVRKPRISRMLQGKKDIASPEQMRIIHEFATGASVSNNNVSTLSTFDGQSGEAFVEETTKKTQSSLETNVHSVPIYCDDKTQSQTQQQQQQQQQPYEEEKNQQNAAAVMIQKLMRGWWQRLQFRIRFLQHQLDTHKERTEESIGNIQKNLEKRKEDFLKKMKKQAKRNAKSLENMAKEAYGIVDELRKENERLHDENMKLGRAMQILREMNEKLAHATSHADACASNVGSRAIQVHKSNERLRKLIPKFQSTIAVMEESLHVGQQHRRSEQMMKIKYLKGIGKIIEDMESRCNEDELVHEVVETCLEDINSIGLVGANK